MILEKISAVGIIKINADKKYIKTLIALSKLNFLPKTENSAKTKAPLSANAFPCKFVKLKVVKNSCKLLHSNLIFKYDKGQYKH